ncbi:MAG: Fic family protein [Planctomycetes bacterium]|nr:Fic family protein [Planctomycetota bacterium]
MRSGNYVIISEKGHRAFVPFPLPPDPPVRMDAEMVRLLSDADSVLGRLDGVAAALPDWDQFAGMFARCEAVLSSQIEGTQSTLEDVLEFETEGEVSDSPGGIEEVVNYVRAMEGGFERLKDTPLSLSLIRETHAELLRGVPGAQRYPGQFRRSQNWVGPAGCMIEEADYIPPPPPEMRMALRDLEDFAHDRESLPALIQCGLAHAQFDIIQPFLDGNGRVGRLLIMFLLCDRQILRRPLLYFSYYLKAHRARYYDLLRAVRDDGDWEGWLKFFLRGVGEASAAATDTALGVRALREQHRQEYSGDAYALALLDFLHRVPVLSARKVQKHLGCSYATANTLISRLEKSGILSKCAGRSRTRRFRYAPYLALFDRQALQGSSPDELGGTRTTSYIRRR